MRRLALWLVRWLTGEAGYRRAELAALIEPAADRAFRARTRLNTSAAPGPRIPTPQ